MALESFFRGGDVLRISLAQVALLAWVLPACFGQAHPAHKLSPIRADGIIRPSSLKGAETAYLPELFSMSHASNSIALRNGDLLCFYFSGKVEGASNVAIVMSRLPKGSHQWTKPVVVAQRAGHSLQNPVPFEPSAGHLWLLHTAQVGLNEDTAEIFRQESTDNGRTWSKPTVLFAKPGSYDRNKFVVMKPGEWMLPMYHMPSASIVEGANQDYSAVQITTDGGRHWKECAIPGSDGLVQPSVVKLSAHHYLALMRSRDADWIYQASSADGCDWSRPIATVLPNNNSSIQLIRLRDGHLVLAFNNSQAQTVWGKPIVSWRRPLSVALSVNGGNTWDWVRDVERGRLWMKWNGDETADEYSYPSIIQARDGMLYLSYTYNRKTIKVMSFREGWIKRGTTDGEYKPEVGKNWIFSVRGMRSMLIFAP